MPMDNNTRHLVARLFDAVASVIFVASTASLIVYLAVQQRHAFIVKCMAELGNNNIELCSSIAK